jgi:uncharacterized Zn finger protein
VALLLAGEMPREIENVFRQAGVSLFPTTFRELRTDCTCPDDANPCKHIAAVYYLLGEEFDRDPFLILRLRGLTRTELMERLGVPATIGGSLASPAPDSAEARGPGGAAAPVADDPSAFWRTPAIPPDLITAAAAADQPVDSVLQRFGRFPFWRGHVSPQEALSPVYERAAKRALELFVGETEAEDT